MPTILAILVVSAAPLLYVAQAPSFGCSSRAEVSKLQSVRSDMDTFRQRLTEQVAYGQCVTIPQGTVVEGSITDAATSTLLINAKSDPPGYVVPLQDFKPR
jgi:hypothetical protein